MKKIDEVIVVEGKMDYVHLHSFLDADIVTTNGSEISEQTLTYIEKLASKRTIIIMTDPDAPGKRIREIIQQRIGNCKHCYIEKSKAIKGKKVGIAETKKEDILAALENLVTYTEGKETFSREDMLELGLVGRDDSGKRREILSNKLHIDKSNGKSMLKKLNMMGLTKNEVKNMLEEGDL